MSQDRIFISYDHHSLEVITPDVELIGESGLACWHDKRLEGGSDWQNEIATAIQSAPAVVCFLSQRFLQSEHCMNEVSFAVGCGKPLLPVFQQHLDLPPGLQLVLGRVQAIKKYQLDEADYREKLIEALRAIVGLSLSGNNTTDAPKDITGSLEEWRDTLEARRKLEVAAQRENSSIFIAPFKALSKDASDSYIAEALFEDLTMYLSRNPDISVLSAGADTKALPPIDAATTANANYLVQGSVTIRGENLTIGARLVDVHSTATVWSERYQSDVDSVFDVQGSIIRKLAGVLGPAIWHSEGQRLSQQSPSNTQVWQLTHRANYEQFNLYTRQTSTQAEKLTRQALAIDPDYSLALSTLAQILANRVSQCLAEDPARQLAEAQELSSRALALAPRDARVLLFAAVVEGAAGHIDQALYLAQSARELDPVVGAMGFIGLLLIKDGQPEQSFPYIREEIDRDPQSGRRYLALFNLAIAHIAMEEQDEALVLLKQSKSLHPTDHLTLVVFSCCLYLRGDLAQADLNFIKARKIEGQVPIDRYADRFAQLIKNAAPLTAMQDALHTLAERTMSLS